MNHRPSGSSMLISKAIVGYLNFKEAEGLSLRSIDMYRRDLTRWIEYEGDKDIGQITSQRLIEFLNWLRNEYRPKRFSGRTHPLSPKTMRNYWVTLSSFFSWAKHEFKIQNPMEDVPAPKFKNKPVQAFTKEEIEAMLKACDYRSEATTNKRKKFTMRRPTAIRDRAIILCLLDSGMRANELCHLKIGDVDLKTGKIEVKHGITGGAKGGKGRTVYLGKTARNTLWRYLSKREDGEDPEAPVFLGNRNRPLNPNALRHLIVSIAKRAGVKNAHPHLFRHTMALTFLRSGGDIFTLQVLLGHNSLDMVRHYSNIAQIDVERAHRKASPVDNWRL